jgi:predicted Zn-dependent protease
MLPDEKQCRRIAERALSFARTEDASVSMQFESSSNTRFANNEISTSGSAESVNVVVSATRDTRTDRVSLNETSDAALKRAMERAGELAGLLPPDPEYVGPLPPQRYLAIQAHDPATAKRGAAERIAGVRAVVEPAQRDGLNSSGFSTNEESAICVANQAGNFGYFRSTEASFSATVRTADGTGSGWGQAASWRAAEVDAKAVAERALRKARDSAAPTPLDPGDYTVILEPAAVSGLFGFMVAGALSARAAEEGRSFFSKKGGGTLIGEKLFGDAVTLKSDPADPRRPGTPWSGVGFGFGGGGGGGGFFGGGGDQGLAAAPITWIRNGVVENLWYDRYWARKKDREPTPFPGNLVLEGGQETLESLIASTERGLLVTNFWYIRSVNPQTLQLTGLTRDGVWLVENGKIAKPVTNFRFNESPAVLLANVQGMTPAVRTGNQVVPAIKAANFTFSSLSDAV